jgi:hypothetical protein
MTNDDWEERYADPWGLSLAEQNYVGSLLIKFAALVILVVGVACLITTFA